MATRVLLSNDFCKMKAIKYVASRYGTTPEEVPEHYVMRTGMVDLPPKGGLDYELKPNELALFHDLGIQPNTVEIK